MKWYKKLVAFFTRTDAKRPTIEQTPIENKTTQQSAKNDEDVDIMARTIWGEARGEGLQGMIAVGLVIMNRYREHKWYSHINGKYSIKSVCLKSKQFSCWNDDDPNSAMCKAVDTTNHDFQDALYAAKQVISGAVEDFTGGANHYFADYIGKPSWAKDMVFCITIGHHNFYKGE